MPRIVSVACEARYAVCCAATTKVANPAFFPPRSHHDAGRVSDGQPRACRSGSCALRRRNTWNEEGSKQTPTFWQASGVVSGITDTAADSAELEASTARAKQQTFRFRILEMAHLFSLTPWKFGKFASFSVQWRLWHRLWRANRGSGQQHRQPSRLGRRARRAGRQRQSPCPERAPRRRRVAPARVALRLLHPDVRVQPAGAANAASPARPPPSAASRAPPGSPAPAPPAARPRPSASTPGGGGAAAPPGPSAATSGPGPSPSVSGTGPLPSVSASVAGPLRKARRRAPQRRPCLALVLRSILVCSRQTSHRRERRRLALRWASRPC